MALVLTAKTQEPFLFSCRPRIHCCHANSRCGQTNYAYLFLSPFLTVLPLDLLCALPHDNTNISAPKLRSFTIKFIFSYFFKGTLCTFLFRHSEKTEVFILGRDACQESGCNAAAFLRFLFSSTGIMPHYTFEAFFKNDRSSDLSINPKMVALNRPLHRKDISYEYYRLFNRSNAPSSLFEMELANNCNRQ